MDKRKRRIRAVELGKDVLIVLLTCSALWLMTRSQLFRARGTEDRQINLVQTQSGARADAARPLRITANLEGSAEDIRYGVQYDTDASDALFQRVAGLLVEALSSAGEAERITRPQWEKALLTAPGVSFDFQGEMPLSVLTGWLSGEENSIDAVVRRLTLTVWKGKVALCYRDEEDGVYYRRLSEVANEAHLVEALSGLEDAGVRYAFESELTRDLDRDTLVMTVDLRPTVYRADNPMAGGRASLEELMGDLGFSVDASSFYSSGHEQVARSGNDSIRLSDWGVAEYWAGEDSDHFQIPTRFDNLTLFESVEACRQLAAATLGVRSGQARLYLMSARETEEGLEVRFGYCLNGAVVRLEQDCAARFLVRGGRIDQFELCFRSYTDSGEASVVLPIRQAAAAMKAMGLEGEELLLVYQDAGGEVATASWAAAGASEKG